MTQAAVRMLRAQESGDREAIVAALRLNWQLWTIIQAELLAPDCQVPEQIRINVLNLSNFIDKHTVGLLGRPNPAGLDVLININRQIAGGLYTRPEDPAQGDAATGGDGA